MWRRYGPASAFLTCAPDDVHQSKAIQLSYRAGKSDAFPTSPETLLPVLRGEASEEEVQQFYDASLACEPDTTCKFDLDERFLQKLATMNPIATTLVYEQMTEAIFAELVRLAPVYRRKTSTAELANAPAKGFL